MHPGVPTMSDTDFLHSTFSAQRLASLLPYPAPDAHKYSRGVVDFFGGSQKYPGAAVLSVRAAQRMGAGYVSAAVSAEAARAIHACAPSAVAIPALEQDFLCERTFASLIPIAAREPGCKRAAVLGPGLDANEGYAVHLVTAVLSDYAGPIVVDGGALGCLSAGDALAALLSRAERGLLTVLTPHLGEAKRLALLLEIDGTAGDGSHAGAVLSYGLSKALHCTVAVKSDVTFVSDGSPKAEEAGPFAMDEGTAALAKAGSGDVLAGMVGALLAQGVVPLDAAMLACHLHARAGVAAAADLTDICVVPEDVIEFIPAAVNSIAAGQDLI